MKLEIKDKIFYLDFAHHYTGPSKPWTIAKLYNSNSTLIAQGVSYCHPKDMFNKRIGRKLALTRLLEQAEFSLVQSTSDITPTMDICREVRGLVWKQYLEKIKL